MSMPRRLSPLLPLLLLAACHGAPNLPPPQPIQFPSPSVRQGVDLASDTSDRAIELKQSRVDFVARYYRDPDSHWPPLSASEARRLTAQGLKIVAVWEWHHPDPEHFRYSFGYADAMMADAQAKAVGQPPGTAIYFAVDLNAHASLLEPVKDYFRGIAAGLAAAGGGKADYRIGVYGSGVVCDAVKGSNLAQYSWLSSALAWDGADYTDWNIRQGERLPDLSFDQDSDEAREDYGGFSLADEAVPDKFVGGSPPAAALPPRPFSQGQAAATAIASIR